MGPYSRLVTFILIHPTSLIKFIILVLICSDSLVSFFSLKLITFIFSGSLEIKHI